MRKIPEQDKLRTFQDLKNVCSMLTGAKALAYIEGLSKANCKKIGAKKEDLTELKAQLNERKKTEQEADAELQKKLGRLSLLESRMSRLAQELEYARGRVASVNEAKERIDSKRAECVRLAKVVSGVKEDLNAVKPVEEVRQMLVEAILQDDDAKARAGMIGAIKSQIADLQRDLRAAMRAAKKAGERQDTIRALRAEITRSERAQADLDKLPGMVSEWTQAGEDLARMIELAEAEAEIRRQLADIEAETKGIEKEIISLKTEVNNG